MYISKFLKTWSTDNRMVDFFQGKLAQLDPQDHQAPEDQLDLLVNRVLKENVEKEDSQVIQEKEAKEVQLESQVPLVQLDQQVLQDHLGREESQEKEGLLDQLDLKENVEKEDLLDQQDKLAVQDVMGSLEDKGPWDLLVGTSKLCSIYIVIPLELKAKWAVFLCTCVIEFVICTAPSFAQ